MVSKWINQAIRNYTGEDIEDEKIFVYPDPKVRGTFAVRVQDFHGERQHQDFLVFQDNPDDVEECEFTEWPPKSGSLNFFM